MDPQAIARYSNLGGLPLFRRFPLSEQTEIVVLAEMMTCPVAQASATVGSLSAQAAAGVGELLSETDVIEALPLLPFERDERVLAIGDSITADRLGWAEMLSLIAVAMPQPRFTVGNMGVGGQTSSDVLGQMDVYADWQPDWILMMVGTNDVRFHANQVSTAMLTESETARNLLLIRRLMEDEVGARLVVITPPPVVRPGVAVGAGEWVLGWSQANVTSIAEFIRSEFAGHIDVHSVLTGGVAEELFEEDGVHPSVHGQRLILRTILLRLPSISR